MRCRLIVKQHVSFAGKETLFCELFRPIEIFHNGFINLNHFCYLSVRLTQLIKNEAYLKGPGKKTTKEEVGLDSFRVTAPASFKERSTLKL